LFGISIFAISRSRVVSEMAEKITWQLKLNRIQKGKSQTGAGII
jgi:hypothetical protein